MNRTTLPLHRRTRIERRVLAILRGEGPTAEMGSALTPDQALELARLRQYARRGGLTIAPPGTPYISQGELALISWIADAQRIVPAGTPPSDEDLAASVRRVATLLSSMRLRLSPLSLYGVSSPDR